MGADFMWAVAPQPELNDDRVAAIRQLIEEITDEELVNVDDNFGCFYNDDYDQMREELLDTVILVCQDLDNRETSQIRLSGMDWRGIITGGMSWGDAPTDAFRPIAMVGYFQSVFDLLRQFSQEDLRNETRN